MKIKNISNKIINFGNLVVMPNEVATLPKNAEGTPAIKVFESLNKIVILDDAPAKVEEPVKEVVEEVEAPKEDNPETETVEKPKTTRSRKAPK